MEIEFKSLKFSTKGNFDIVNITDEIEKIVRDSAFNNGQVTIFVPGSTGALTTIEYESGLIRDFKKVVENLIPEKSSYAHNSTWGDGNAHSHLRSSLIGPSISIPFSEKNLTLGTWQQIVFIDFDNRARSRSLVVQIIGEK